jgi:hypothetical protein
LVECSTSINELHERIYAPYGWIWTPPSARCTATTGRVPEGHGNLRLGPHAASSYSWMSPPRMSRLRTPPGLLAGAGGSNGASGARRSSPRCGRLAL